jgi:hypothetical protein
MGLQIKPSMEQVTDMDMVTEMRPNSDGYHEEERTKSIYERVAHKLLRKKTDYNLLISDKNEGKNDFDYRRLPVS